MRRVLIVLLLAFPLYGHEGLHEQIEAVTRAIADRPRDAALHLKRGELHRVHRQWKHAERDYERARALDGELHAVELAHGRMLFQSGRVREAVVALQRYVRMVPQHADGHLALARAWMRAGRTSAAIDSFERALSPRPDPEVALEYVAALVAGRRNDDALRYLDSLGPILTYQLAAIDLELRAGNHASALRRVDAAAASAVRKEQWLERRGDILMMMGREAEARTAYRAALDALSTLPPARRRTRAIQAMEQRLQTSQLRLDQREQQPRAEKAQ